MSEADCQATNADPAEGFIDETARESIREAAASALAEYGRDDPALVADLISRSSADQYQLLLTVLKSESALRSEVVRSWQRLSRKHLPATRPNRSGCVPEGGEHATAISLIQVGDLHAALRAFQDSSDPEALTQFVHQARERGLQSAELVTALDSASNVRERFAILLAVGGFRPDEFAPSERSHLKARCSIGTPATRAPRYMVPPAGYFVLGVWDRRPSRGPHTPRM